MSKQDVKPQVIKTKSVEWSYPSSPNAVKFGFNKVGCWTVETTEKASEFHVWPPKALKGFASYDDAKAYCESLPCEWSRLTK